MKAIICFIGMAVLTAGQTKINGDRTMLGRWNAGEASSTRPVKTGLLADRPTACVPGDLYFATDNASGQNLLLCTAMNAWASINGGGAEFLWVDPREVRILDEFQGSGTANGAIGDLGWLIAGTGATWTKQASVWPALGLGRLATGVTSGYASVLHLGGSNYIPNAIFNNTDKKWEAAFVFRSNQTVNANIRVGLVATAATPSNITYGLAVKMGATNWEVVFADGSENATTYDLGVAIDTSFHTFRIYSDGTMSKKVYFQLDGGTARSACNSGCDLTISAASAFWTGSVNTAFSVSTSATAAATLDVDYYAFRAVVGTTAGRRN
jgi:hypothetical protein